MTNDLRISGNILIQILQYNYKITYVHSILYQGYRNEKRIFFYYIYI